MFGGEVLGGKGGEDKFFKFKFRELCSVCKHKQKSRILMLIYHFVSFILKIFSSLPFPSKLNSQAHPRECLEHLKFENLIEFNPQFVVYFGLVFNSS